MKKGLSMMLIAAVASSAFALPALAEGDNRGVTGNNPGYGTTGAGTTGYDNNYQNGAARTDTFGTRATGPYGNRNVGANGTNNRVRAAADNDNDGAGWLGLLGLLGLAGLMGRNKNRNDART